MLMSCEMTSYLSCEMQKGRFDDLSLALKTNLSEFEIAPTFSRSIKFIDLVAEIVATFNITSILAQRATLRLKERNMERRKVRGREEEKRINNNKKECNQVPPRLELGSLDSEFQNANHSTMEPPAIFRGVERNLFTLALSSANNSLTFVLRFFPS